MRMDGAGLPPNSPLFHAFLPGHQARVPSTSQGQEAMPISKSERFCALLLPEDAPTMSHKQIGVRSPERATREGVDDGLTNPKWPIVKIILTAGPRKSAPPLGVATGWMMDESVFQETILSGGWEAYNPCPDPFNRDHHPLMLHRCTHTSFICI